MLAKLNPDDTEVVNFYRGALMAIPNTENVPADFWKKIGWKGQPPKDVPYDFWLHVGMALHSLGPKMWEAAFALWVEWSVQSRKHTDEELLNGWEHFSCDREQKINAGSLIRWAKAAGWQFPQNPPAAIQEILDAIAKTDICAIKAEMEADPKNAAKILIKRIVDVDIGALEEDELFRLAIKLSDIKARPLQRALKQARAKHAEEHRRRYETGETVNGRVRLFVDMSGPNETLAKVREILSSSKSGLYDRGAIITQLAKCEGATLAFEVSPDTLVRIVDEHCIPWTYTEAGDPHNCLFPRNYAVMYNQWLGQWDLPVLNGICSSPLIFEDGTVVCKEGYDEASGMYCEDVPNIEALIPSRPTKREAEEALMLIRKTFKTFCFADAPMVKDGNLMVVDLEKPPGLDESSFLCSLLTAVARASIWLTPGFLYRASPMSGAGTGKGKLARCNSIIAFGHQPIATSPGHSEEELDKRIIAALISGRPIIFLDNLNNRTLSSDTIASLLTDRPARVRVFGRNDKELPINSAALLIVTGNGVVLAEDICRRFVIVDFDARIENPESRPFDYDILEEVKTRRNELLTAVLTILRWGRQNKLTKGLPSGSFPQWEQWVRDPLLALGCCDPIERFTVEKKNDPNRRFIADLFDLWWRLHGRKGIKLSELDPEIVAFVDEKQRGRQYITSRVEKLAGTRLAGFVLNCTRTKWNPAIYQLEPTDETQRLLRLEGAGTAF